MPAALPSTTMVQRSTSGSSAIGKSSSDGPHHAATSGVSRSDRRSSASAAVVGRSSTASPCSGVASVPNPPNGRGDQPARRGAAPKPTEKARHQTSTVENLPRSTPRGISYCWFPTLPFSFPRSRKASPAELWLAPAAER